VEVKDKEKLIKNFVEQLLFQFPEFKKEVDEMAVAQEFYYCLLGDFGVFIRNQKNEDIYIKVNDFFNLYLQYGIDEIANLVFVGFFEGLTLEPLNRLWGVSTGEIKKLLKMYFEASSF